MVLRGLKWLSPVFGFVLLALFAYGAFVAIRAIASILVSLDSDIAVAIVAAAATVFVSVLSIVLGKVYESRAQIEKEHREKKIPVYEDLLKFMFDILMGGKTGTKPSESDMLVFMMNFTQRIMVWGADDVVAAWVKWKTSAADEEKAKANAHHVMFLYEDLIKAIRRDLGHKNKGLERGDLLALFITDIDRYRKVAADK